MEKKIRKFTSETWVKIQPYIFIILMISTVAIILMFGVAAQTVSAVFIAITLVTYALIATEKMHRTLASLGGAISTLIALKITGKMPDLMQVISGSSPLVDWGVILIIISVAIISEIAKDSGLFDFITIKMIKRSGGDPLKLLLYFSLLMVLLSALLGDVPAFMIVCTLTMMVTRGLDLNPVPYVMSEIIVSNATAVVTVVASFVNLLVAGSFGMDPTYFLSYVGFLAIGLPFALIAVVITYLYVKRYYRKDLVKEGVSKSETEKLKKSIMELNEKEFIKDPKFFRNSAFILVGTLILFALSSFIGIPFYVAGLIGAFAFIFMSGIDPVDAFHRVDWSLIFFIMGLFIVVGGLDKTGVLAAAGSAIGGIGGGSLPLLIIVITLFSGTLSGFLDDISVATALIYTVRPMMIAAGLLTPTPIVWAIIISANLGGNISPIGGVANIMGITALQKAGKKQTWGQFFKVGVPLTFIFLVLAMVYLIVVAALLGW